MTKGLDSSRYLFEENDFEKQRAGLYKVLRTCLVACCGKVLKEKNRYLSRQTSVLYFSKSLSGTHSSPPIFLDTGDDYPYDSPRGQMEMPPSLIPFALHLAIFLGLDLPSQLNHCVSTYSYVVSTNVFSESPKK